MKTIIIGALLLTVASSASVKAEQHYVSLAGKFSITYPDDWAEVDYRIVDAYLMQGQADRPIFDYDAAFAVKNAPQFFSGDYFILTVDTVGELDERQIDSVLSELSRVFGKKVTYHPLSDFIANLKPSTPSYDPETKTVTILNKLAEKGATPKKNLLMMKFYNRGIATFYFYSPDSLFESSKSLFEQIVGSFSTENIDALLPKERLKLADLKDIPKKENGGRGFDKSYLFYGVALVLIVFVIMRRLIRRRSR